MRKGHLATLLLAALMHDAIRPHRFFTRTPASRSNRQTSCDKPLIEKASSAITEMVLYQVVSEGPPGCDGARLSAFPSLVCADQIYTDSFRAEARICSEYARCDDAPLVANSLLSSVSCTCETPSYPNPARPMLAAYEAGGCLVAKVEGA